MLSSALAVAGRSNATSTARSPAVRKNVKPRFCVVFILNFYLLIVCLVGFIGARAAREGKPVLQTPYTETLERSFRKETERLVLELGSA